MCDPTTAIAAVGLALSAGGTAYSISAQQSAANAQRQANDAAINAQNQAFWTKANAQNEYTANQGRAYDAAFQAEQDNQNRADANIRSAQKRQAEVTSQENSKATEIRKQADAQQQQLLDSTSGQNLTAAQAADEASRGSLVDMVANNIGASSPFAGSSSADTAGKIAQAADSVRSYGKQMAKVAAYGAPGNTIANAIGANQVGLMPIAAANQLLQSGQTVQLLPTQTDISNAEGLKAAGHAAIESALQGGLNIAKTGLQGADEGANLAQGNTTTIANNNAGQVAANSKVGQAVGGMIGNIGGLGAYLAGRYGTAINGYFAGTPSDAAIANAPVGNGSIITGRKAGTLN